MSGTLPPIITPILDKVRSKIRARDVPLDFWQIESSPKILDGFMDLASQFMMSDLEESRVPHGDILLAHLFS